MLNKTEEGIQSQTYIDKEMIEATFNFWYNNDQHIRSPFPIYIRDQLSQISTELFLKWAKQIDSKAKNDINDEILAEKFEEIIFETAMKLVLTEDEKLTISYPFLLRINDVITVKDISENESQSKVVDRSMIKKGDNVFMKVIFMHIITGEKWETEFELPQ